MQHLQYPIGKFDYEKIISDNEIPALIGEMESLPSRLKKIIFGFTPQQLEIPYRPGGWNSKQVVHHLADSHMNAYIRFNLSLTEDAPVIRPYIEHRWAELPYKENVPLSLSLDLLVLLHRNLVTLLRSLTPEDYERTYIHPEYNRVYKLRQVIALYAWHGNHHLAHITNLKDRGFAG